MPLFHGYDYTLNTWNPVRSEYYGYLIIRFIVILGLKYPARVREQRLLEQFGHWESEVLS